MLLVDRSVNSSDWPFNTNTYMSIIHRTAASITIYQYNFRFGRRILLIVSDILMGISMIALGLYFVLKETESSKILS